CAAAMSNYNVLYPGSGTKLTVEPNI
nr:T cell receptor V alpha 11, TCR V alpha 11=major histocompatibility complex class II-dependent [mice, B6, non-transgenic, lymph node cells, Peptide Partial, 25 aa] [Mus sp.]